MVVILNNNNLKKNKSLSLNILYNHLNQMIINNLQTISFKYKKSYYSELLSLRSNGYILGFFINFTNNKITIKRNPLIKK